MADTSRWMVRLGAFLLLGSPLLPQAEIGGRRLSPVQFLSDSAFGGSRLETVGLAACFAMPALAGALLLAGSFRPVLAVRSLTLGLLLLVSFAEATLGSILLTLAGGPQGPTVSFPLSLASFLLPLLLGGVAIARLMGGDFGKASGGFDRLSLAVLLAVNGLFLADSGWDLLISWSRQNGTSQALAGAWVVPAGGLFVAAGEILSRLRPRAAVDTVPASG